MTTLSELERRITALEEQERARAFLRSANCEAQRNAASRACEEMDRRVIATLARNRHADLSDPQMDREIKGGPASNNLSRRIGELVRQAEANFEDPQVGELA